MRDQASALRERPRRASGGAPTPAAEVAAWVVGGGKGGTGVSLMSLLLASAAARRGRRVLLLDAAFNQGNLHVLLGCRPALTWSALLACEAAPAELLVPVREGLWLLPADSGVEAMHVLTPLDRARLLVRLAGLMDEFDLTVVDAGTGIEGVTRAALTRASRIVAVTSTEPAALVDTYALLKILALEVPSLPVHLLVNRVTGTGEGRHAHERLDLAARRFLDRSVDWLGEVADDDDLRRAVQGSHPLADWDARVAPLADHLLAQPGNASRRGGTP